MEKDMTRGNPMKLILQFAFPVLLGNIVQQFYNIADTMIVGRRLGSGALAAVGATGAIVSLLFSFIFGFTSGFAIVISKNFGAEDQKDLRKSVAQTYVLGMLIIAIITVIAHFVMPPLLSFLGTPEDIFKDSLSYIRIVVWGLPITMLFNIMNSMLKSVGNSVIPLVFLGISSLLNVALDFLFIFGMDMGVAGAAYATVIAQAISVLLCGIFIWKEAEILHVEWKDFKPDLKMDARLTTTGFSMAFMLSLISAGSVVLQAGINGLGTDIIAAHTAGRKIIEFGFNPFNALGAATATFTGQNSGAGESKRIRVGTFCGVLLAWIWTTAVVLVTFPFAQQMIGLITDKKSTEILEAGALYLRITAPFFYFLGMLVVIRNVLQGIGKKFMPIFAGILELAGKTLAVFLLVPAFGYLGVCVAEPMVWVVDGILVMIAFLVAKVGKKPDSAQAGGGQ